MSDFSDLCPLFNTGVYGEIQVPHVTLANRSTSERIWTLPPFGRSVIVTDFYVAKETAFAGSCTNLTLLMCRAASAAAGRAAVTAFASVMLSATETTQAVGKYLTGTTTDTTFTATQCLAFFANDADKAGAKHVSIIVRYKEK